MTNQIMGSPMWVWAGVAVALVAVLVVLVVRGIAQWRRSRTAGERRRRLTPAPFRAFLPDDPGRGAPEKHRGVDD